MITGFLYSVTYGGPLYMTLCHSSVPSKQQITDTPKYDSYDDVVMG